MSVLRIIYPSSTCIPAGFIFFRNEDKEAFSKLIEIRDVDSENYDRSSPNKVAKII